MDERRYQKRRAKTTAAEEPRPTVQHHIRKNKPESLPAKAADSSRWCCSSDWQRINNGSKPS
ncbi:MAG: hypothetical protein ACKO2S_01695, partial [Burkholderiaceae bacterium]